jgi:ferredoxin-fold anticodon binding domain-containing protein
MEPELSKYLNSLEKGEKISLVLSGLIVEGTLDEVVDNCVVLTNATSQPGKRSNIT